MAIDYAKNVNELAANSNRKWFKPEQGKYFITVLDEPTDTTYTDPQTGEITPQWELKIRVSEGPVEVGEYTWTIGKSRTISGIFGQLNVIGAKNGKLEGVDFNLLVKRSSGKNEYTIPEALDGLPRAQQAK